ncbi:MAG: phosphomethylpyrimidine synthase ThiC [Ignisphaera sp.]
MVTQNIVDEEIRSIALKEKVDVDKIIRGMKTGRIVVLRNIKRKNVTPVALGEGLSTKVNVNVGTSGSYVDLDLEVEKVKVAMLYGADSVMDLSTGGDIDEIRRKLLSIASSIPFGTVPTYQAWIDGVKKFGSTAFPSDWYISIVEKHLKDGVDFMTIHAGLTRELAEKSMRSNRLMPIVSRGGSMLAVWMLENSEENPYLKHWEYLLELFKEYEATISLGDALRPGTIVDAHDYFQIAELLNNSRLARDAIAKGVKVIIEGPGHMTLDKIVADIKLMKSLSGGVPYFVLGPLVTDIALGYDHIATAIGAAIAAAAGADFICYLTPSEHLSLPNVEQVKEGLIATKIAAHAGDIIKRGSIAALHDIEMSLARANLDWEKQIELSLDPEKSRSIRTQFRENVKGCTMCGQFCVFILLEKYTKNRNTPSIQDLLKRFNQNTTLNV